MMTSLTLEPLERWELMTANLLAEGIVPPAPLPKLNDIGAPRVRPTRFGLPASDAMGADNAYTHNQTGLELPIVNSSGNDRFPAPWATLRHKRQHECPRLVP
jgi:hypothetical protein